MTLYKGDHEYKNPIETKPPNPEPLMVPPIYVDPSPEDISDTYATLDSAHSGLVATKHGSAVPTPSESKTVPSSITQAPLPPAIEQLLSSFKDVFPEDLPQGLPPSRATDHRIDLIPVQFPRVTGSTG